MFLSSFLLQAPKKPKADCFLIPVSRNCTKSLPHFGSLKKIYPYYIERNTLFQIHKTPYTAKYILLLSFEENISDIKTTYLFPCLSLLFCCPFHVLRHLLLILSLSIPEGSVKLWVYDIGFQKDFRQNNIIRRGI